VLRRMCRGAASRSIRTWPTRPMNSDHRHVQKHLPLEEESDGSAVRSSYPQRSPARYLVTCWILICRKPEYRLAFTQSVLWASSNVSFGTSTKRADLRWGSAAGRYFGQHTCVHPWWTRTTMPWAVICFLELCQVYR